MSGSAMAPIPEPQAIALLHDYGIPYPDHGLARSAGEAVGIAGRLGYPVVLKVVSPDVIHKSDVGGVAVELGDASSVSRAHAHIARSVQEQVPGADIQGLLVCKQAPPGLEVIVGAMDDTMFGPTLMFGLGGMFAEVLKDITFRIIPIQHHDAEAMVREIQGYPLLVGTRGQSGYDVPALIDLLLAVARLVVERPEIEELDLNPVRLYKEGLLALDARLIQRAAVKEGHGLAQ